MKLNDKVKYIFLNDLLWFLEQKNKINSLLEFFNLIYLLVLILTNFPDNRRRGVKG